METLKPFQQFMSAIANDPRVGSTHIALYMALYSLWLEDRNEIAVVTIPQLIMQKAKISARGTYVKTIKELNDWGYLCYRPSFNNRKASRVVL